MPGALALWGGWPGQGHLVTLCRLEEVRSGDGGPRANLATAALGGLPPLAESTVCVSRMCSVARRRAPRGAEFWGRGLPGGGSLAPCACVSHGRGRSHGPAPARPPMLLFFNKTRADGIGLRAFLPCPLCNTGPGRAPP